MKASMILLVDRRFGLIDLDVDALNIRIVDDFVGAVDADLVEIARLQIFLDSVFRPAHPDLGMTAPTKKSPRRMERARAS